VNDRDFLTELRLSRQSGLPLTAVIASIDPARTELSPVDLETIRRKVDAGSVRALDASTGRTYLRHNLVRYFSMVVVLGFLVGAVLSTRLVWMPMVQDVLGEEVSILEGRWMLHLALWTSLIVCPCCMLAFAVLEYRERKPKKSRSPGLVQRMIDTGEAGEKIECAILLCFVVVVLLTLALMVASLPRDMFLMP